MVPMNVASSPAVSGDDEALLGAAQREGEVVAPDVVLAERVVAEGEAVTVEPRDQVERRACPGSRAGARRRSLYFHSWAPTNASRITTEQHEQAGHRQPVVEEAPADELALRAGRDRELALDVAGRRRAASGVAAGE